MVANPISRISDVFWTINRKGDATDLRRMKVSRIFKSLLCINDNPFSRQKAFNSYCHNDTVSLHMFTPGVCSHCQIFVTLLSFPLRVGLE